MAKNLSWYDFFFLIRYVFPIVCPDMNGVANNQILEIRDSSVSNAMSFFFSKVALPSYSRSRFSMLMGKLDSSIQVKMLYMVR